jgi:hypothetical protein
LAEVPTVADRLRFIEVLRELFPDSHILIVSRCNDDARSLAPSLNELSRQPVSWGNNSRHGWPWTHVDSVNTFTGRSVMDWAFVVFWHAELMLSRTCWLQMFYMFGSRRSGFLTRDDRQLNECGRAVIEGMFGPVVYRPDNWTICPAVCATWLAAPAYPPALWANALRRKRDMFWQNSHRNQQIALTAQALQQGNTCRLRKLGLDEVAKLMRSSQENAPTVAIVIESPEHGRELVQGLPGWRLDLASESISPKSDHSLKQNTILTLSRALKSKVVAEIVVYAAGGGKRWIDSVGLTSWFLTGRQSIVIDVADDCDPQSKRDVLARRADFQRRGWTLLAEPYARPQERSSQQ